MMRPNKPRRDTDTPNCRARRYESYAKLLLVSEKSHRWRQERARQGSADKDK